MDFWFGFMFITLGISFSAFILAGTYAIIKDCSRK